MVFCRDCKSNKRKALWLIGNDCYCNYHFERHMETDMPFAYLVQRLSDRESDFKWSIWKNRKAV